MCGLAALVLLAQQAPVFSQATVSGIVVTEFNVPEGRIQVYLPEDLAAGDTLSGMVYVEPKGSGSEREANARVLQGVVVSIDSDVAVRTGGRFVIRGMDKSHRLQRSLKTKTFADGPTYEAPIQVGPQRSDVTPRFVIPEVSPSGRPLQIVGTFDGDNGTTNVSVGGKALSVLVETPRTCIVQPDASFVGRKSVSVADGGRTGDGHVVLPKISLAAEKTALARGERTRMTVTVEGLEGLGPDAFPIPIELRNETPQIISLARYTNMGIEQAAVRDGVWTRTLDVSATAPGSFVVTGLLFMVTLHDAKRAMTPAEFNDWLRGLKVLYEEKLKSLQKEADEEAKRNNGRVNDGLSSNIGRKKKLITVIDTFVGLDTEGEKQVAAVAIDKLLADEAFFSLAADLISLAADMLGYTEVPLPGIGALLKGAKAVSKGLPKVVRALEKAEKLHEELEKVKDAKEKLDKAKELKDALDDAKKTLEGEK